MRRDPDRAAHHREVLGAHEHRATVDLPVAGDETVGRRHRRHPPSDAAGLYADLTERVGVEQPRDTRPRVEPAAFVLAGEPLGPAHRRPRRPAHRQVLEERVPVAHRPSGASGHRRGDRVGVVVAGAVVRLQHPRALQEQVDVDLPGEAHAAEDLGAAPAVQHRGLTRQERRGADRAIELAGLGIVEHTRRRVDGDARQLRAHRHVGAEVLHRLERADRPVELAALLRVVDGQLGESVGHPDAVRRGEERALASQHLGRSVGTSGRRRDRLHPPHRRERIERPVLGRTELQVRHRDQRGLTALVEAEHVGRATGVLDVRRAAQGRVEGGGDDVAPERGHERPGDHTATELLVDHDGVHPGETVGPKREHTRTGELLVHGRVEPVADTRHREPPVDERTDAVAQRELVVGEIEGHQPRSCAFGAGRSAPARPGRQRCVDVVTSLTLTSALVAGPAHARR